MQTTILSPTPASIQKAAELLRAGELVAFPTETVYGLGANALDANAVKSIFAAKGRPGDNPLISHIAMIDALAPLIAGEPSSAAVRLMDAFWPGPITMVFPRSSLVPDAVTAGLDTAAVRMPSHPVAQALIEAAGVPIAAPSANRSGRPSPTTAEHVFEDMQGRVPLILDGGACQVGVESTVIDFVAGIPRILRPGGVTKEMIASVAGECLVDGAVMRPLREGEVARSPGMKYRHYAPKGALTLYSGEGDAVAKRIAEEYDNAEGSGLHPLILAFEANLPTYGDRRTLSLGSSAEEAAQRIFAALRDADQLGADRLFTEAVDTQGIGLAVMNRLGRAAAFDIVNV